jgi:hypothetical protein
LVERVSEGAQGVEGLGRGVHSDSSCLRRSPMSTADADPWCFGLKDKLSRVPYFAGWHHVFVRKCARRGVPCRLWTLSGGAG